MENEEVVVEETTETTVDTTPDTKIASSGAPQRAGYVTPTKTQETPEEPTTEKTTELEEVVENVDVKDEKDANLTQPTTKPELTDDEIKELYSKRFPTTPEVTEEEKIAKAKAAEMRLAQLFVDNNGKIEDFARIKQTADLDATELAKAQISEELKAQGFTLAEAQDIIAERYYQIDLENLEEGLDETEDEFEARKASLKKKAELGAASLSRRGETIKKQAATILNTLSEALNERDLEAKQEEDFIAKVDSLPTLLPKKITLELGKLKDKDLGSVTVDVDDHDIAEVVSELKDPAKRKQLLFNDDGSLNEKSIASMLLRNKMLEKAARESWNVGSTAQADFVSNIFPARNPNALGVGGSPAPAANGKGKVASFGRSQRTGR